MTSPVSRALGSLPLPASLPLAEFDAVNERVASHRSGKDDIWYGFASAWNAVAYRLRAALEHGVAFTASVTRSSAPPPDERYRQDHDLFGFVVSALSAVECFHFAAYCIGTLVAPAEFPLSRPSSLRFYPDSVRDRFQRGFPAESLTGAMVTCLAASEYSRLTELRSVLVHRGTPPRMTFFSTSGPDRPSAIPSNLAALASQWSYDLHLQPQCLEPYAQWLESSIRDLVVEASVFSAARL